MREQELKYLLDVVIRDVRFKPGWRVWADRWDAEKDGAHLGLQVFVEYTAPDAYNPFYLRLQKFRVGIRTEEIEAWYTPEPSANEDDWSEWIFAILVYADIHETSEFFLYKGKRVYDPHAVRPNKARGIIPEVPHIPWAV